MKMMKIFTSAKCSAYSHPGHPERPERISATSELLKSQTAIQIDWANPAPVTTEQLLRAHTKNHLARLEEAEDFEMDTPYYPKIAEYARESVGAALASLDAARKGENVFSLMRPPGHHATRQRVMGFCFLNNIAIAALEALATGTKCVAVYDFDVHHGNGTEAILTNQPGAWFCSIHQHPCYPGTGTRNVGSNCFNYPLVPHTPRGEYRKVLTSALDHLLKAKPELLLISAGFDAYARDPLAQQTLEPEDFYWLGQILRKTGLPIVSLLEGGYSADLPELVLSYLKGVEDR
jgi:acetoin utilization deacetylase AcuC-like enzyme